MKRGAYLVSGSVRLTTPSAAETRQNLAGEGLGDRADAEERISVGRGVRSVVAAAETLDRRLAVDDCADDEGRGLGREEQDLAGEADRLVERGLRGARRSRPRKRGGGEEGEDFASAHGGPSNWMFPIVRLSE